MRVLSEIRALRDAIAGLTGCGVILHRIMQESLELQRELGGSEDRLEELERTRARWEAEMEALQLRAESTYKSAGNAEARSRTMLKHAEKLADPLDFDGEEIEEDLRPGYAPRVEEEGMLPLRLDVAPTNKENALRYKFS